MSTVWRRSYLRNQLHGKPVAPPIAARLRYLLAEQPTEAGLTHAKDIVDAVSKTGVLIVEMLSSQQADVGRVIHGIDLLTQARDAFLAAQLLPALQSPIEAPDDPAKDD